MGEAEEQEEGRKAGWKRRKAKIGKSGNWKTGGGGGGKMVFGEKKTPASVKRRAGVVGLSA